VRKVSARKRITRQPPPKRRPKAVEKKARISRAFKNARIHQGVSIRDFQGA
jgi:hypothetical protein